MASGSSKASKDQIREFKKAFRLFDRNKDGKISANELSDGMKKLGFKPTRKEIRRLIAEFDSSGSDAIEMQEFIELMMRKLADQVEERSIIDTFKIFDHDDDGYITVEDMREIIKNLGEDATDGEIDNMIREVDKDNDGKISYKEFVQVLMQDQFMELNNERH